MKATSKHKFNLSIKGFTLVELLIAMVVAFLALEAIYSTFLTQHRSYRTQEETAEMQQNLRAAMLYMKREIRMAGCDPAGTANAGLIRADRTLIRFREDVRGNSSGSDPDGDADDPNEDVAYSLKGKNLVKNTGGGNHMVAENIDAIDFLYLDGSSPPHVLNDPIISGNVPATKIHQIRSVEVTIVARTNHPLLPFKNNNAYFNQRGTMILPPQHDRVARKRLTAWIKCRNLGL